MHYVLISDRTAISQNYERQDTILSLFVGFYFVFATVNSATQMSNLLPLAVTRSLYFLLAAILAIFLILSLPTVLKRKLFVFSLAELAAILTYLFSISTNPTLTSHIFSRAFWTICICIPLGTCVQAIGDKRILYSILLKASYIIAIFLTLLLFAPHNQTYMMAFSYSMLYPCLFTLNEFLERRKTKHLIFSIYCIMTILLFGSRGALLCTAVFIAVRLLISNRNPIKKFLYILIIVVVAFFIEQLLRLVMGYLTDMGLTSRSINLLQSDLTYVAGRTQIWEVASDMVRVRWMTGWGVVGELNWLNSYPHSIFWEIMIDFGVIIGGVLLVVLIYPIVRMLKIRNSYSLALCLVFFSTSTRLLVSGTYLTCDAFFIFIFLALSKEKGYNFSDRRIKEPSIPVAITVSTTSSVGLR